MHRSTNRILTTHPGRLPNPDNYNEVVAARKAGDQQQFDALVHTGILAMIAKQRELGLDILSDGEFWKARDQQYFDSRVSGIEAQPLAPGEWPSLLGDMPERQAGEFKTFYDVYDRVGNTPRPGVIIPPATEKNVITAPVVSKGTAAIDHEIAVVKQAIAAAGEQVGDFFFPVLGPGWWDHFIMNEHYKTEEEYCYGLAELCKPDFKAVVDAGFILQIDDPGLVDTWCMMNPPVTVEEYRKRQALRIEATNYALQGLPEDRVRYHTCWGSWHTPHTTDSPLAWTVDLMLDVKAGAYSIEAADVQHILDYRVWEETKFPDGKVFIPGVIAHKTSTVEPPALVAERIIRYATIMGRENVIAGVDCGVGGRCYPEIGWAKLRSLAQGAELASKQLWGR